MTLNPSPTEVTTAATDAALGLLCIGLLLWLVTHRRAPRWKRQTWGSVFVLLATSSLLGAWAHGFDLSAGMRAAIWRPLYLSLGLTVAMFVVGAVSDWRAEAAGRRLRPWAIAAGLAFFVLTQITDGAFALFIAYEAAAILGALLIYLSLFLRRALPGAGFVTAGLVLTLLAAVIQQFPVHATVFWPFDHNGLFHLVQIVSVLVMAAGLRRGLESGHVYPAPGT